MHSVTRITCQPTAGELGALLRESRAVKEEMPLYNRRLRRTRKLWSIYPQFDRGDYLQPAVRTFNDRNEEQGIGYGVFRSQLHARNTLYTICEEQQLCPRVLGFDRGKGPCFQYQLGRCRGACSGKESMTSHNERLLRALDKLRITAWPYSHPLLLREKRTKDCPSMPAEEWHLVDNWAYLGSWNNAREALGAINQPTHTAFDRDAYQILSKGFKSNQITAYRCNGANEIVSIMTTLEDLERIV